MAKKIIIITSVLGVAFVALFATYCFIQNSVLLSILITVGVFFYHFAMRLLVGTTFNRIFKNKIDYNKAWFREKSFEKKLFKFLKVKKWKKFLPTYSPETFDTSRHSMEEIASSTCQSEVIHEIIFLLSYLPILLYIPFGELAVFICTSVFASLIDLSFVILQRFNRPRLINIINKRKSN